MTFCHMNSQEHSAHISMTWWQVLTFHIHQTHRHLCMRTALGCGAGSWFEDGFELSLLSTSSHEIYPLLWAFMNPEFVLISLFGRQDESLSEETYSPRRMFLPNTHVYPMGTSTGTERLICIWDLQHAAHFLLFYSIRWNPTCVTNWWPVKTLTLTLWSVRISTQFSLSRCCRMNHLKNKHVLCL